MTWVRLTQHFSRISQERYSRCNQMSKIRHANIKYRKDRMPAWALMMMAALLPSLVTYIALDRMYGHAFFESNFGWFVWFLVTYPISYISLKLVFSSKPYHQYISMQDREARLRRSVIWARVTCVPLMLFVVLELLYPRSPSAILYASIFMLFCLLYYGFRSPSS
jgi:hypothetical protein